QMCLASPFVRLFKVLIGRNINTPSARFL
ncbi:hypothetical protein CP8484711_0981B, partial [Chlamydia psittaci 84-8471/1]